MTSLCFILYIVSSGTFSIGIGFEYNKDKGDGLFVEPRYENFKEEMMNYKHINIDHYKREILPKAMDYSQTELAKALKPDNDHPEHGVFSGEVLSIERIISIILYCDFTSLSSHFTSTFRKRNAFEPLQSTKKRHAKYYWFSKTLKGSVQCYGTSYDPFDPMHGNESLGILYGPFYCGMSTVMNMPQFNIHLLSPTSTSCQISVAIKFSGDHGLLIEFDNNEGQGTWTKGLDVSWLSRFKEEDERYHLKFVTKHIF